MKTNTLLIGEIGTGKTRSLLTLLPEFIDPHTSAVHKGAGLETFVISLERGAEAVFGENACRQGLHRHFITVTPPDWRTFGKYAKLAATMSMDSLVKMVDPGKSSYTAFAEAWGQCEDFVCDVCGEHFGDASEWGEERCLCLDGMTGISKAAMQAVVGAKPIRSLPEYGFAMSFIEGFMTTVWQATRCSTVVLAHLDRQTDPVTGASRVTLDTWGDKLAPKLIREPDEIAQTMKRDGKFFWSTVADGITLKRRRLSEGTSLEPSFRQIFQ